MQAYNINIPGEASNTFYRIFKSEAEDKELHWHKDNSDRVCYVVEGSDWSIQYDDCLPVQLKEGDIFKINKYDYHRLIRGGSRLVLKIEELIHGCV